MAEAILEQEVCLNCGAEVRPDTQFCYNCGKAVSPLPAVHGDATAKVAEVDEKDSSLADLEKALAASRIAANDPKSKIEAAAAERKRARIGQRKPLEVVWDRPETGLNWVYFLSVAVIFVLVLITVAVTILWK